jgi:hypothetical protein
MVIAEDIGVKTPLGVFGADSVMNAVNPPLGVAPNTLNVVGVSIPSNVLFSPMLDGLMGVTQAGQTVITGEFIGVDGCPISNGNLLLDDRKQRSSFDIWGHQNYSFAVPFHHSDSDSLASGTPTTLTGPLPANVRLIDFNRSKESDTVFSHNLSGN